jgi:hypothetical protein
MQTYNQRAELVDNNMPPEMYPVQEYPMQGAYAPEGEMFARANDLRVIQEYNREENMPLVIKKSFWGLISKSVKLGFWKEEDEREIFLHKNVIKVGHIMSKGRHRYTFEERQQMNQMDFLVYADFKRGVGMEKYRINERTLQATSVQQHIQGAGGPPQRSGGIIAGIKNIFG